LLLPCSGIARGEGLSDALSVSSSRLTPKRSGGIITPGGAHSAVDIPGGAFGAGTTTDLSTPEFAGAMDRVRSAREQLKRTPYEKEARIDLGLAGALAAQSAAAGGSNGLVRKKADMRASGHVRRAADAAMLIREDLALAEERRRSLDALHLSEASSLMRALVAIDGEIADTGIADTGETAARRLALEGQLESALRRARFAEERLR